MSRGVADDGADTCKSRTSSTIQRVRQSGCGIPTGMEHGCSTSHIGSLRCAAVFWGGLSERGGICLLPTSSLVSSPMDAYFDWWYGGSEVVLIELYFEEAMRFRSR